MHNTSYQAVNHITDRFFGYLVYGYESQAGSINSGSFGPTDSPSSLTESPLFKGGRASNHTDRSHPAPLYIVRVEFLEYVYVVECFQ